jgi:hypothetical protein
MKRILAGYLLVSFACFLIFCILTSPEGKAADPPVTRKWDNHKLLWEYNKDTGIFKQFKYEIAGQWVLKKVNAFMNIDRNREVDKDDPWLYTLTYDADRFMNMIHNGAALKLIPERFLPSFDSLDDTDKKDAIFEVLSRDRLDYIAEMEKNKERVAEMQQQGKLELTQAELAKLVEILDYEISRTRRNIEDLRNDFTIATVQIQKKHDTYFVGKKDHVKILEADWDGLVCSRETRFDPWSERKTYEKIFEDGMADKFYETDRQGTRHLYAQYENVGIQMSHIHLFDSNNVPSRKILFNSTRVSSLPPLYTYRPAILKIRVSETKTITWPPKLQWPVESNIVSYLMCHNDHAILPKRAVRR